jgi:hypothetical protein
MSAPGCLEKCGSADFSEDSELALSIKADVTLVTKNEYQFTKSPGLIAVAQVVYSQRILPVVSDWKNSTVLPAKQRVILLRP